jgi:hypothetical protein
MTVISAGVFVTLSLPDDVPNVDAAVLWTRDEALDTEAGCEGALCKDIRLHAVLLVAMMGAILWMFW